MTNLIKAETYKILRNKTFWGLIVSITGFSALLHLLVILDWWLVSGTAFDQTGLSDMNAVISFTMPLVFNLIVSTLASFYIAKEFSQSGVIKNQIMSGNKRTHIFMSKYLVFSLGSIIVTLLIPFITAIVAVILFGQEEILTFSNLMYLGRAFSLFALQFLSFTAIVLLIAIVTEDSGKTILFTLLFSVVMFAIEKLITAPFIKTLYEHTIFNQFSEVFKVTLTNGEIINAILVGVVSLILIILCGIIIINRKEIK
ncbi:MAG TPA: ABC transporter permease [Pseudogracilibacillus sp.]|nr:ABC transporter permease [Pseudogracilibacillus sp.]